MTPTTTLDTLFEVARRRQAALVLALSVGDDVASMVTAARLKLALNRLRAAFDAMLIYPPMQRAVLRSVLQTSTETMEDLLRRAPTSVQALDPQRFGRWITAPGRSTSATFGPDLFELDVTGNPLVDAAFLGLHVARCRFITDMHRASFQDAFVDKCDFTYSNLRDTLWQATEVHWSYFRDSSFAGATFDRTTFVDCDMRRADFSLATDRRGAATGGLEFVRCDLRGTNWRGRPLSAVRMIDCELDDLRSGMRGRTTQTAWERA